MSVRLHVPVEPLWTNGRHDAAAQRLEWPAVDLVDAFAPLALRYAVWVEPEESRQGALLGERRLAGLFRSSRSRKPASEATRDVSLEAFKNQLG